MTMKHISTSRSLLISKLLLDRILVVVVCSVTLWIDIRTSSYSIPVFCLVFLVKSDSEVRRLIDWLIVMCLTPYLQYYQPFDGSPWSGKGRWTIYALTMHFAMYSKHSWVKSALTFLRWAMYSILYDAERLSTLEKSKQRTTTLCSFKETLSS